MNSSRFLPWFAGLFVFSTLVAVSPAASVPTDVVLIDRAVSDPEALAAALRPGTDLLWVDAGEKGWREMAAYFQAHRDLRSVHVISHGEPGAVLIAGGRLDAAALSARGSALDAWRTSLAPGASIAFYGCNVGRGKEGRRLVEALSARLGAEVSASDNPTGQSERGGDWHLEVFTGAAPAGSPFMGRTSPDYRGLLLPTVGTQTINTSTFTTDSNSPTTFSNTYFTISGVNNGTNSTISIYDSGPPGAGGLAPGTVDNSGPPYGTRVYKLVVTAKSAAMGSFKLSAINLQSFQPDYYRNITIRATPSDGTADIISTPYSTGTGAASAGPYPVVLGATLTNTQITKFAVEFSLYKSPEEVTNSTTTDNMTLVTFDIASPLPPLDSDGTVTAGTGVTEPVALPTTATTSGGAASLFDFKINDGGTADTVPLTVSQIVVNTSGTADFSKVTWLLNGPDVTNVVGTYSSGSNTITFSGLGISVANASNETYTVKGYYNNTASLTENQTYILSVNGSSGFTVGTGRTKMAAGQSAVTNGTGAKVSVTATKLLFTTQPSGSTSGAVLTGQPVVKATDAVGNVDVDFVANVTLAVGSGAGSLSGTLTKAGVSGVSTFTDVAYSATADQQAFTLTTSNVSSLTNATSGSVTSDVVATVLQFSMQPVPTSIPSGTATAFSTVPVVRAVNSGGIVDTAARNVTLTVTNTSGGAAAGTVNALGGVSGDTDASTTIVTIPAGSGVATFTGLSVTYTNDASSTNSIALHAVSSGLTAANSTTITSAVSPAITSTLTASGTYGTAISTYTITGSNTPTSYSATGLPAGLSVNTTNGQITGTPTTNGSFNVTIGATNAGGTGTATLVFTVAKAALSITGVAVDNKTYDGTTASTLNVASAALSGVVNSDILTLNTGGATGTFTDKDVGTGKAVTVSGFTVSGTNSGNYTLSQPTGLTANITTKALTASGLSASAKTYDGTTTATLSGTAALQGAEAGGTGSTSDGKPYTGDTVSLSGTAGGVFASKDAASGISVTVSGLTLTGAQASNYSVTQPTGLTATITTKALTVSGLSTVAKVYDGLTTASLSGTAALQGTEAAGAGTTSDGKPYSVDSVSLSGTAAATFADQNVGTAKAVTVTGITLTGTGNTNYTVTQPTGLTANITAATLTVTADAKSRAYGAANPTFTATITGYVNSETSAVLTGTPSVTTTATNSSVPNTYAITAALGTLAANNGNYIFGFVDGTLTIVDDPRVSWRVANFGTVDNTGSAADSADPDGDGLVNLLEYALGSSPLIPTADALPTLTTTDVSGSMYLTLAVTRNSAATDLTFTVEATDDLSNTGAWTTSGLVTLVNTSTALTVRDSTAIGAAPRFMRLRVATGVVTPPMGGLQFSLAPGGGPSAPVNTYVSLPFARPIVWSSAASGVTAQTITATGAGWSAGQFTNAAHYVELLDGALAGLTLDITSHTSDTLTLATASLSGYSAGMRFAIRAHATLASAFGATTPTSLAAATTIGAADEVRLYDSVTQAFNRFYYKSGGGGGSGWRGSASTSIDRASTVIRPSLGIVIVRKSTGARILVALGEPHTAVVIYPIEPGYNWIAITQPVATTLAQQDFITGNSATGMVGDADITTADELQHWTGAAWERLFYNTTVAGWRSSTDASTDRGSQIFQPGEAVVIQRKRSGEALFTRPASP